MAAGLMKQEFEENAVMRMRQPLLAIGFAALAVVAGGCAGESAPDRGATKVLRADEVKITLGETPPDAGKPAASTAEGAGSAP
jgi:hypothetical protein